jgi:hypothetical protein
MIYGGGAILLVGALYYVFLFPQYPIYDNLPEYPPPPSRNANAFQDYYEAASKIEPDGKDFKKVAGVVIEFATAGFPLSATLAAYSAEMNERYQDALDRFREGTRKETCHVYLEYYDLEVQKMRAAGELSKPEGMFTGLLLRAPEDIGGYTEKEWIKEGHRSTELKGDVTQGLLLLAFVESVNAIVIADASGTASAIPYFGEVLRAANHLEEDHLHPVWFLGSILRDRTVRCLSRFAKRDAATGDLTGLLPILQEARSRIRPLTRARLLAVSSPLLRNVFVGRLLRGSAQQQSDLQMDMTVAEQASSQAVLDLFILRIALESARKAAGEWPKNLDGLGGILGGKIPADPFSGAPYRMVLRDGKPLLYCVGPDGVDQEGETKWNPEKGIASEGDLLEYWD